MITAPWIDDLNGLLARFPGLGVSPDLASVSLCELWGVYCFLRHLAEA